MTMPCERTRALRFAGEVLGEVVARTDVPEDLRRSAKFALRHYPSAQLIALLGRYPALADWLEPEQKCDGPTLTNSKDSDDSPS